MGTAVTFIRVCIQQCATRTLETSTFRALVWACATEPNLPKASITNSNNSRLLPFQAKTMLCRAKREFQNAQEYQKYADRHRRPVEFQVGQRARLKANNSPCEAEPKAPRDRNRGSFTICVPCERTLHYWICPRLFSCILCFM